MTLANIFRIIKRDSLSLITNITGLSLGLAASILLIVFIFLYRDSVISTLRTICALRGFALAARSSGKIKAVIQAGCAFLIIILMIPYSLGYLSYSMLRGVSIAAVSIAAVYALFSGVEYMWANRMYVIKLLTDKGGDE